MIYEIENKKPIIHKNALILPQTSIIGDVEIYENVSIWFGAVLRGDNDKIYVGKNSNIQDNCTLHTDYGYPIIIGENVTVGHNVILHGCRIEGNAIIGMGSTLLDGVIIPKNVIIGANSLLSSKTKVEEGSLYLGSPARFVRKLTDEEIEKIGFSAKHYTDKIEIYKKLISS